MNNIPIDHLKIIFKFFNYDDLLKFRLSCSFLNESVYRYSHPSIEINNVFKNMPSMKYNLIVKDSCFLTDEIIISHKNLVNIIYLNLWNNNKITDAGVKNLVNITNLNLGNNNKITDAGVKNLVNITTLDLWDNNTITDAGIKNLVNIKTLDLTFNSKITDAGIKNLINLRTLKLLNNNIITTNCRNTLKNKNVNILYE